MGKGGVQRRARRGAPRGIALSRVSSSGRVEKAGGRVGLWVVYRGSGVLGRGCVEKQGCRKLVRGFEL